MAERSVVDVLRAAKERISDTGRWTTECYAADRSGATVIATSQSACSWCAIGSVLAELRIDLGMDARHHPVARAAIAALDRAAGIDRSVPGGPITALNDQAGHPAVIQAFDRAIKLAEASA